MHRLTLEFDWPLDIIPEKFNITCAHRFTIKIPDEETIMNPYCGLDRRCEWCGSVHRSASWKEYDKNLKKMKYLKKPLD